jgi:AmmeMemoRadiSam system protein A
MLVPALDQPPVAEPGVAPAVALSDVEREGLLDVARVAVAVAVGARPKAELEAALSRQAGIDRRGAAFVTLTEDEELRGCIGHMDAEAPVLESVVDAAMWAALGDPRFPSVRADELPHLHLEVSVLGSVVPSTADGWRLGVDGIMIERGGRRGLLLPEVAPMLGMDRTAMLDTACRKAGLPPGAWRDPRTTVYAFRTDRFGGPA